MDDQVWLQNMTPTSDDIKEVMTALKRSADKRSNDFSRKLTALLTEYGVGPGTFDAVSNTTINELSTRVRTVGPNRETYIKAWGKLYGKYTITHCATEAEGFKMNRLKRVLERVRDVNNLRTSAPEQSGLRFWQEYEAQFGLWWEGHNLQLDC